MEGGREVAWVCLAVSVIVALYGMAPDPEGSPVQPTLGAMMTAVALLIAGWLLVDRRHHHS